METNDIPITHAHLFTMPGDDVGYIADGAVAAEPAHRTLALLTPIAEGKL